MLSMRVHVTGWGVPSFAFHRVRSSLDIWKIWITRPSFPAVFFKPVGSRKNSPSSLQTPIYGIGDESLGCCGICRNKGLTIIPNMKYISSSLIFQLPGVASVVLSRKNSPAVRLGLFPRLSMVLCHLPTSAAFCIAWHGQDPFQNYRSRNGLHSQAGKAQPHSENSNPRACCLCWGEEWCRWEPVLGLACPCLSSAPAAVCWVLLFTQHQPTRAALACGAVP